MENANEEKPATKTRAYQTQWTSAEPCLPPELVGWGHLIARAGSTYQVIDRNALVAVVRARHNVPRKIACDAVSDAVHNGFLDNITDEKIRISEEMSAASEQGILE